MKKLLSIIFGLAIAIFVYWLAITMDSPYSTKEFGSIWYGTENEIVTVRKMDTEDELYTVYLCELNYEGEVTDYQKIGIYEEPRVIDGVNQAVELIYGYEE